MTSKGFGPLGPRAAASRPAADADAYTIQTWFKNCSAPGAADGTVPTASWFNTIIGNLVYAAAEAGVLLDNDQSPTGDPYLWNIIQAAITQRLVDLDIDPGVVNITEFKNLPIYPDMTASNFTITTNSGSITVDAVQEWTWRGWKKFLTTDFLSAARTLSHTSSKTYHVRWYAPGHALAPVNDYPNGRFMLRDLEDATYNPSGLAETNAAFDTTFDDMLIARVVTNGSNVATVTALKNKAMIKASISKTGFATDAASWSNLPSLTTTINWARTPQVHWKELSSEATNNLDALNTLIATTTRYSITSKAAGYTWDNASILLYNSGTYTLELFA